MSKFQIFLHRAKQVPGVHRALRPIIQRKMSRQIDQVAKHFFTHFELVIAANPVDKQSCYRVRHEVYCNELGFERKRRNGMEQDDHDAYSIHCLIRHKRSGEVAGTVRLVAPTLVGDTLPLETHCPHAISADKAAPSFFSREEVCEVSRLAVPKQFRRRGDDDSDKHKSPLEVGDERCFPYVSLALYFMVASVCRMVARERVYVMMEPKLARSLKLIGLTLEQLGDTVDYHGKRSAYRMSSTHVMDNLSPALKRFHDSVESVVKKQPLSSQPNLRVA